MSESTKVTATTSNSVGLKQHPLALQLVPGTMPEEEYEAFKADIKKRGQQQDIIMFEGMVLDGWHRNRACRELGLTPKTKLYEGSDPSGLVIALNVLRRKLGSTQRALAGAQLNMSFGVSQDEAAKRVGVSKVHVNLVVQALQSKNARVIKMLENPNLTREALHEELIDCGVVRTPSAPTAVSTISSGAALNGLDALFGNRQNNDDDDDLLGGEKNDDSGADSELGDVLGEPPSAGGKVLPTGSGKTDGGMPTVGSRPSHPERRNRDTPPYRMAEAFKGFSESDKITAMQMMWPTMRNLMTKAGLSMATGENAQQLAADAIGKAASAAAAQPTTPAAKPAKGAAGTKGASKAKKPA